MHMAAKQRNLCFWNGWTNFKSTSSHHLIRLDGLPLLLLWFTSCSLLLLLLLTPATPTLSLDEFFLNNLLNAAFIIIGQKVHFLCFLLRLVSRLIAFNVNKLSLCTFHSPLIEFSSSQDQQHFITSRAFFSLFCVNFKWKFPFSPEAHFFLLLLLVLLLAVWGTQFC